MTVEGCLGSNKDWLKLLGADMSSPISEEFDETFNFCCRVGMGSAKELVRELFKTVEDEITADVSNSVHRECFKKHYAVVGLSIESWNWKNS